LISGIVATIVVASVVVLLLLLSSFLCFKLSAVIDFVSMFLTESAEKFVRRYFGVTILVRASVFDMAIFSTTIASQQCLVGSGLGFQFIFVGLNKAIACFTVRRVLCLIKKLLSSFHVIGHSTIKKTNFDLVFEYGSKLFKISKLNILLGNMLDDIARLRT